MAVQLVYLCDYESLKPTWTFTRTLRFYKERPEPSHKQYV